MISTRSISEYLEKYRNKATVVREIHSNIAEKKRWWDLRHTLATIILGAGVTFMGFMGADRIFDAFTSSDSPTAVIPQSNISHLPASKQTTVQPKVGTEGQGDPTDRLSLDTTGPSLVTQLPQAIAEAGRSEASINKSTSKNNFVLLFSLATLSLFIVSTLNLIYRWKEDHMSHFRGVVQLTAYINWLDELRFIGISSTDVYTLKRIRDRYQSIVEALPPNNAKDYLIAKKTLAKKTEQAQPLEAKNLNLLNADTSLEFVVNVAGQSPLMIMILKNLREIGCVFWLGGGSIRNQVWDEITGSITPIDDFDVIYFDKDNLDPAYEKYLEKKLSLQIPEGIKISVKNQARMHLVSGEPANRSLEDAIAQWPETATAIAIRLNELDEIVTIAPYGYSDLLNMVVRPTPYHAAHRASYEARKASKNWDTLWPGLSIES
jgi:hypothetical protein